MSIGKIIERSKLRGYKIIKARSKYESTGMIAETAKQHGHMDLLEGLQH